MSAVRDASFIALKALLAMHLPGSPTQRHDVESVASAGALQFAIANRPIWGSQLVRLGKPTPAASTNFGLQALK